MVLKKCVITVCQNYFQKQCLDNTETVTISVEQNQRIKRQMIGCVRYMIDFKYLNKYQLTIVIDVENYGNNDDLISFNFVF